MKRRTLLKTAAAAAGSLVGGFYQSRNAKASTMSNDDFNTAGKFDEDKAKDGVIAMCKRFGYPVFPDLRENLWVSDYGTGQFSRLGLAACIFANHSEEGTYMLLDLFIMPNQMLPEHWHLEGDLGVTKNEGWLVRWGKSYIGGIGDDNLSKFPQVKIPEFHCGGTATTKHVVEGKPGMFVPLAKLKSRHWQFGGPEGAILSEVANLHTSSAVRHSDEVMNKYFLDSLG